MLRRGKGMMSYLPYPTLSYPILMFYTLGLLDQAARRAAAPLGMYRCWAAPGGRGRARPLGPHAPAPTVSQKQHLAVLDLADSGWNHGS